MYAPLAVLGLWVGPVLAPVIQRTPSLRALLDGLVLVSVAGLVLFEILPAGFADAGWAVVLTALCGFVLPHLAERSFAFAHSGVHKAVLALGTVGLLLHAVADGAALSTEMGAVTFAVLLHQLPVGLLLWTALRQRAGAWAAFAALGAMTAATLLGYGGAAASLAFLGDPLRGHLLALVGGGLLHVLFGHGDHDPECHDGQHGLGAQHPFAGGVGALLGVALLVGVFTFAEGSHGHDHGHAVSATFVELFLVSGPALVVGFLLAGFAHAFLPHAQLGWLGRGSSVTQALKGMALGLPLPVCSCGVVPLYRTLVMRGVPPAAAVSFLVATPELGLDAFLLSFPLLGFKLTLLRLGVALVAATVAGVVVAAVVSKWVGAPQAVEAGADALPTMAPSKTHRVRLALREGLVSSVDMLMPWLIVGLAMAAVAQPLLEHMHLQSVPRLIEVPLFALIGIPAYVCATAATPFAAVLIAYGVSGGAAIAFLLTGPATNITTFGVLRDLHGKRVAVVFGVAMLVITVGLGWLINGVLGPTTTVPIVEHQHEHGSVVNSVAAVILCVLFAASLLRKGPRAMLEVLRGPKHPPQNAASEPPSSCCATGTSAPAAATLPPASSCCASEPAALPPASSCCATKSAAAEKSESCCGRSGGELLEEHDGRPSNGSADAGEIPGSCCGS